MRECESVCVCVRVKSHVWGVLPTRFLTGRISNLGEVSADALKTFSTKLDQKRCTWLL